MRSASAQVVEVHVDGPGHGPSIAFSFDPIHFDFEGIFIFVTDPLTTLESVGNFANVVVLFGPSVRRIFHQGANLIKETHLKFKLENEVHTLKVPWCISS